VRVAAGLLGAALAACGPSSPAVDAGGGPDARLVDARADGATPDGFTPDSLPPDAPLPDGRGVDAGGCTTATFVLDGALDASAPVIAGGVTSVRLAVTVTAAGVLYVATDDAGEGSDHFVLVSGTAPGAAALAAPFAKAGTVAAGTGPLLFLADENDNDFEGWFRRETGTGDTLLSGTGYDAATGSNGGVLEGTLDLAVAFGAVPTTVYLAAVPYASADGGGLVGAAQTPTGDGDGDVEAAEYVAVSTACP